MFFAGIEESLPFFTVTVGSLNGNGAIALFPLSVVVNNLGGLLDFVGEK